MNSSRYECLSCGFELWNPVAILPNTLVGLYDDGRFPGRCIVSFQTHKDDLTELSADEMSAFMAEAMNVSRSIQKVTGCERVNFAVLGNAVQHVHAHLIPRYPDQEQLPHRSPWSDPRPLSVLNPDLKHELVHRIRKELGTMP